MKKVFLILCILFLGIGIAAFTSYIFSKPLNELPTDGKVALLLSVMVLFNFLYYIKFKVADILCPAYFFSLVYFGFLGVAVCSTNNMSDNYFSTVFFAYVFFALGLEIGQLFPLYFNREHTARDWDPSTVYNVGRVLFFITFAVYVVYSYKYGIAILSSNVDKARTLSTEGQVSGYFNTLSIYFFYPVAILFFQYIIDDRVPTRRRVAMSAYVLVILVLLLGTGVRGTLLMVFVTGLLIYHYMKKNFTLRQFVLLSVIPISAVALIQIFRVKSEFSLNEIFTKVLTESYVNAYNLSIILDHYRTSDFLGLKVLWMGLSILFPGRQVDVSMYLKDYFNLHFGGGGLTPTIVGSFYIGFGYTGIYIGMVVFGLIVNILYRYMLHYRDGYHIQLYSAAIIFLLLSIRNGAMYGAVSFSYVILIFILNKFFIYSGEKQKTMRK